MLAKCDLRLGSKVDSVRRSGNGFEVVSRRSDESKTEFFDAVVVATG